MSNGKPTLLKLTACATPSTTFIRLRGELDVTTGPLLTAFLDRELRRAKRVVVFDLSALDFIDVAGARALARAVTLARQSGRTVATVSPRRPVERVLRLIGFAEEVALRAREESAWSFLQLTTA